MTPERKKQIEDEEREKFAAKKETEDETAYRAKVKANLESGGMAGSVMKLIKDVLK